MQSACDNLKSLKYACQKYFITCISFQLLIGLSPHPPTPEKKTTKNKNSVSNGNTRSHKYCIAPIILITESIMSQFMYSFSRPDKYK